mgnify:FL=1
MKHRGGWILTFTGKRIYPLDPRPDELDIYDIAHALSLQCRFNGHVRVFYSVAEHLLRVSRILPAEFALWGLLHDTPEAYLGDLVSPIKYDKKFGKEYREAEKRLMGVIARNFGLTPAAEPRTVKFADRILLVTEARDLMDGKAIFSKRYRAIEPLEKRIVPMFSEQAEQAFLDRYYELDRQLYVR